MSAREANSGWVPSIWNMVDCVLVLAALWAILVHVWNDLLIMVAIYASLFLGWIIISGMALWRLGRHSTWLGPLAVPAILVGLFALLSIEFDLMLEFYRHYKPPRPMFHNDFVTTRAALLPAWQPSWPKVDGSGHYCWADHEDNLLVIVVRDLNKPPNSHLSELGYSSTNFTVGAEVVSIARQTDRLILIEPDGSVRHFGIRQEAASQFDRRIDAAFLIEVAQLLQPGELQRYEKWYAGWQR